MTPSARTVLLAILSACALTACTIKAPAGDSSADSPGDSPTDSNTTATERSGCAVVADDATSCASAEEVDPTTLECGCGSEVVEVLGEGVVGRGPLPGDQGGDANLCCYPVLATEETCDYGRPYLEEGKKVRATACDGDGWAEDKQPLALSPEERQYLVASLPAGERKRLADAWTSVALEEHASVAAFSRLSLELLAAGAPARLLDGAHRAARDEIRHTRLALALAESYGGNTLSPGPFPFSRPIAPSGDLVALAVSTAREGCINETLSTLLLLKAAETADDRVAPLLRSIAADELRHMALAWEIVQWAMKQGGAPVHEAVAAVFDELSTPRIADMGLVELLVAEQVAEEAIHAVIHPAARALLAA